MLEIVKTLLGISPTDENKDVQLNLYIDVVTQRILNYCNIHEMPDELQFTAAQMVVDLYREFEQSSNVGEVVGNVSSVSEGGRTVGFSTNTTTVKAKLEERIGFMRIELNRFRQLYRIETVDVDSEE